MSCNVQIIELNTNLQDLALYQHKLEVHLLLNNENG